MVTELSSKKIVVFSGLTKTYAKGDTKVTPLDGIDLSVSAGEFVVFMGPSGSGKSTLLNIAAGIDKPTAGRVLVSGEDITDFSEDELAAWRTRTIGYVFQQFNLMPVLTAYENVELPLLLLPLTREKRRKLVLTALELVGLTDRMKHYPRQLSGGQEQRVAIARAIATDPKIILADEPTGNLDRSSAEAVLELFSTLNLRYGKTILLVTHDPAVAEKATRIVHIDKGKVNENDSNDKEHAA